MLFSCPFDEPQRDSLKCRKAASLNCNLYKLMKSSCWLFNSTWAIAVNILIKRLQKDRGQLFLNLFA